MKRPVQCSEQQESPSNITKYFACHASVSSRLDRKISELLPPNFSSLFFLTIYSTLLLCSSLFMIETPKLRSFSSKLPLMKSSLLFLVCIKLLIVNGYGLSAIQRHPASLQTPNTKHLNYWMSDLPLLPLLPHFLPSPILMVSPPLHRRLHATCQDKHGNWSSQPTSMPALIQV